MRHAVCGPCAGVLYGADGFWYGARAMVGCVLPALAVMFAGQQLEGPGAQVQFPIDRLPQPDQVAGLGFRINPKP